MRFLLVLLLFLTTHGYGEKMYQIEYFKIIHVGESDKPISDLFIINQGKEVPVDKYDDLRVQLVVSVSQFEKICEYIKSQKFNEVFGDEFSGNQSYGSFAIIGHGDKQITVRYLINEKEDSKVFFTELSRMIEPEDRSGIESIVARLN